MNGDYAIATATYKGSGKKFFELIAEQLDIPTTEDKLDKNGDVVGEKPMTMDRLKEEIALNCLPNTCLIFPEAKRLTTGIRYWLEDLMNNGVRVVCFAVVNPNRDIFLDMIEIEIKPPEDSQIRAVMRDEANLLGLNINDSRLAELQTLAGRNPAIARKIIRRERLGMNPDKVEHSQYLDISPLVMAALAMLAIVRFIGMGTGNKGLYIVGGIAMMVGMSLKYLGRVRGSRRKYGQ
ncbi:hypothetical protein [Limnoraphis robusta]|uniref:hypothetical protein n=1 Tax=Limnoraphis robusta TaxID=1118279 RepID=UPI002B2049C6|nr:hypothetical protein [Limnoraphis robusta]MEA5498031.1 hypothetical protein [Limnoraphis robusta BA-68 BA1]